MAKRRVLVLCTGNSCRSQLAEAIINHERGEQWQAFSAGTKPAGYVHPLAVQALAERGIQHQGVSKGVEQFLGQPFDLVITVCDDAAENCPVWLGQGKRAHIGFPDPAKAEVSQAEVSQAEGSQAEVMAAFRAVRDDIRARVLAYLDAFEPGIKPTQEK